MPDTFLFIRLQALRKERGYDYDDICTVSPDKLPNYEEKIKSFFEEHIHTDEVWLLVCLSLHL